MGTVPYTSGTVLLLAGTEQGLFLLTSRDRVQWDLQITGLRHRAAHDRRSRPMRWQASAIQPSAPSSPITGST